MIKICVCSIFRVFLGLVEFVVIFGVVIFLEFMFLVDFDLGVLFEYLV